ncbi:MAG: hypothetical protein KGQ41_06155 [Alphaproteobacteria bacterium]|nr:hypothetical protein [Alphaproteobacteria bacterium]
MIKEAGFNFITAEEGMLIRHKKAAKAVRLAENRLDDIIYRYTHAPEDPIDEAAIEAAVRQSAKTTDAAALDALVAKAIQDEKLKPLNEARAAVDKIRNGLLKFASEVAKDTLEEGYGAGASALTTFRLRRKAKSLKKKIAKLMKVGVGAHELLARNEHHKIEMLEEIEAEHFAATYNLYDAYDPKALKQRLDRSWFWAPIRFLPRMMGRYIWPFTRMRMADWAKYPAPFKAQWWAQVFAASLFGIRRFSVATNGVFSKLAQAVLYVPYFLLYKPSEKIWEVASFAVKKSADAAVWAVSNGFDWAIKLAKGAVKGVTALFPKRGPSWRAKAFAAIDEFAENTRAIGRWGMSKLSSWKRAAWHTFQYIVPMALRKAFKWGFSRHHTLYDIASMQPNTFKGRMKRFAYKSLGNVAKFFGVAAGPAIVVGIGIGMFLALKPYGAQAHIYFAKELSNVAGLAHWYDAFTSVAGAKAVLTSPMAMAYVAAQPAISVFIAGIKLVLVGPVAASVKALKESKFVQAISHQYKLRVKELKHDEFKVTPQQKFEAAMERHAKSKDLSRERWIAKMYKNYRRAEARSWGDYISIMGPVRAFQDYDARRTYKAYSNKRKDARRYKSLERGRLVKTWNGMAAHVIHDMQDNLYVAREASYEQAWAVGGKASERRSVLANDKAVRSIFAEKAGETGWKEPLTREEKAIVGLGLYHRRQAQLEYIFKGQKPLQVPAWLKAEA